MIDYFPIGTQLKDKDGYIYEIRIIDEPNLCYWVQFQDFHELSAIRFLDIYLMEVVQG